jgi:hypothetical protein
MTTLWPGIAIWEGGNNNQVTPILMDFNLVIGNVNGMACPIVRYFSTRMQVMKGLSSKVRPPLMNMELLHSRKAPRSVGVFNLQPQRIRKEIQVVSLIPTTGNNFTMQIHWTINSRE